VADVLGGSVKYQASVHAVLVVMLPYDLSVVKQWGLLELEEFPIKHWSNAVVLALRSGVKPFEPIDE
jgi:hypothetical protein